MNTEQTVGLYRTKTDFVLMRNRVQVRRVKDKGYAFRLAKQVFTATMKLSTGPVIFQDFTNEVRSM